MSNVQYLQIPTEQEGLQNRRASATSRVHSAIHDGRRSLKNLPGSLKEALEVEAWKDRPSPLGKIISNSSFVEWVEAAYPRGLDATVEVIRNLLRDDVAARNMLDAAVQGDARPGGRTDLLDNIQEVQRAPTGTAIDAGLRRLRKAAEDKVDKETGEIIAGDATAKQLLEDVLNERISVHAACIGMGWRKATITVRDEADAIETAAYKKSSPLDVAKRAFMKMSAADQREFLGWTTDNMKDGF